MWTMRCRAPGRLPWKSLATFPPRVPSPTSSTELYSFCIKSRKVKTNRITGQSTTTGKVPLIKERFLYKQTGPPLCFREVLFMSSTSRWVFVDSHPIQRPAFSRGQIVLSLECCPQCTITSGSGNGPVISDKGSSAKGSVQSRTWAACCGNRLIRFIGSVLQNSPSAKCCRAVCALWERFLREGSLPGRAASRVAQFASSAANPCRIPRTHSSLDLYPLQRVDALLQLRRQRTHSAFNSGSSSC